MLLDNSFVQFETKHEKLIETTTVYDKTLKLSSCWNSFLIQFLGEQNATKWHWMSLVSSPTLWKRLLRFSCCCGWSTGKHQQNQHWAENETTSHQFLSLLFHNSFTGRVSHAPTCTHRLATKTYNKKISDYNTHRGRVTSFSAPVYIFIGKNYLLLHYIRLLILTYRTFNRNLIILGPNCRFHERKSEKLEICDFYIVSNIFHSTSQFFPPTYLCHKTLSVTLSCSGECSRVCAGCRPGAWKLIRLWSSWMHTPHAHSLSHFCVFKGRLLPSTSPSKFSFSSYNVRLFFSCFGFLELDFDYQPTCLLIS